MELIKIFNKDTHRPIRKWNHYFDIYERHFNKFCGQNVNILEIGISEGGSLQMWKEYFGPKAKIYGVDILPECKIFEENRIKVFIGSQDDRIFLKKLVLELPQIDIIIDDGGHTMNQQIMTFRELYPIVKHGGIYVCEDTHTSYWINYGGGFHRRNTFIEFGKSLVDQLHAHYSEQGRLKPDYYTKSIASIHFYDSIVIFDKQEVSKNYILTSGNSKHDPSIRKKKKKSIGKKIEIGFLLIVNSILRFFNLGSIKW